ncbi:MAG: nucleoside deaminase [Vulcanimicrobiota bacterium]
MDDLTTHEKHIRRTMELARQSVNRGNHPFGALLERNGYVVMEAENTVNDEGDCTGHAELNLVRKATRELSSQQVAQATLYTSTEPCPMCAGAIFWAGISRIVYGVPAAALIELTGCGFDYQSSQLYEWSTSPPAVIGPVLAEEGLEIHRKFWKP